MLNDILIVIWEVILVVLGEKVYYFGECMLVIRVENESLGIFVDEVYWVEIKVM